LVPPPANANPRALHYDCAVSPVIDVSAIRKTYGRVVAVDEVSFSVEQGEIFGLIGPNGAGKTTTMECVEGLRRPDRGNIRVLGLDPSREATRLQTRIGVQLQQAQLQKRITVREAVGLWATLYPRTVDGDELLERLGLTEKRDAWFMHLSGGQKQRLFIALALINDPDVVFLDELTTGLDPQARRAIWDLVRGIRDRGKTVLLTTHLMEEAERLCDRIAIVDRGRAIEVGAPAEIARRHASQQRVVVVSDDPAAESALAKVTGVRVTREGSRYTVTGAGTDLVSGVIRRLAECHVHVLEINTIVPTLEDVFLELTGHSVRD
jgi:ABC-2 type transport system ATP-binding protein